MLLLWIGVKLIAEEEDGGDGEAKVKASDKLLAAVRTVIVADLVMSIDNVLGVAAAAKGSLLLLVFGLVVSIPLVIAGSQIIMQADRALPDPDPGRRRPAGLGGGRDDRRGRRAGALDRRRNAHVLSWAVPDRRRRARDRRRGRSGCSAGEGGAGRTDARAARVPRRACRYTSSSTSSPSRHLVPKAA